MRRIEGRKHVLPEIPTASTGDIAFLLIIFFLVGTTCARLCDYAISACALRPDAATASGNRSVNSAPFAGSLCTSMRPPHDST